MFPVIPGALISFTPSVLRKDLASWTFPVAASQSALSIRPSTVNGRGSHDGPKYTTLSSVSIHISMGRTIMLVFAGNSPIRMWRRILPLSPLLLLKMYRPLRCTKSHEVISMTAHALSWMVWWKYR